MTSRRSRARSASRFMPSRSDLTTWSSRASKTPCGTWDPKFSYRFPLIVHYLRPWSVGRGPWDVEEDVRKNHETQLAIGRGESSRSPRGLHRMRCRCGRRYGDHGTPGVAAVEAWRRCGTLNRAIGAGRPRHEGGRRKAWVAYPSRSSRRRIIRITCSSPRCYPSPSTRP